MLKHKQTRNNLQKNLTRYGGVFFHHIRKHHKKYIAGSLTYIVLKLLIVNGFIFKLLIVNGLMRLGTNDTILGASNNNTYNQGIETINQTSKTIATSGLQKTIATIEQKTKMRDATIYTTDLQQSIINLLRKSCSAKDIAKGEDILIHSKGQIEKTIARQSDGDKLLIIEKLFDVYKTNTVDFKNDKTDIYCQQKYMTYGLLAYLRNRFIMILTDNELANVDMINNQLDSNKSAILLANVNDKIKMIKKTTGRNLIPTEQSHGLPASDTDETTILRDKMGILAEYYAGQTLQKLVDRKILKQRDIDAIQQKIAIEYMTGCEKITGSYSVSQSMNGEGTIISSNIDKVTINVNICASYQYVENLEDYITKIVTHEVGHHIYYFRDSNPARFTKLCRSQKKKICTRPSFVSDYAMQNTEEDYAETFLSRVEGNKTTDAKLTKKLNYFSALLK